MSQEAVTGKTILVVDDEANIRRLMLSILGKVPEYHVEAACDGKEALAWLEQRDFACDLVVTDMQMPRMNGEDLIEAITRVRPEMAILVLTAHRNDKNVLRCLELGAAEYLIKPIRVRQMLQTVARIFDRKARFQGAGNEIRVQSDVQGWVELTAPTDFEYVERFNKFTNLLGDIPLSDEDREDIRVALDELGQNAVEWGNRNDRGKRIHLSYCVFKDRIVFKIEDEGEGFDPVALRDPSKDPMAHIMERMREGKRAGGYGVFITRKLMDDVLYNENGNCVLLTKFFKGGGSA